MKKYLLYFALHYPKSAIEDYIKMIHQSEYHLNETITNDSYAFLVQEYEKAKPNSKFLYEYISEDVVRVNLGNYKLLSFRFTTYLIHLKKLLITIKVQLQVWTRN